MNRCYAAALSTTAQKILTCEMNEHARIDLIWINNASSSNDSFTLHHVKAGQSPVDSNTLAYQTALNSKRTTQFEGPLYLEPGDSLQALAATADRINIHVYAMVSADNLNADAFSPVSETEIRYE